MKNTSVIWFLVAVLSAVSAVLDLVAQRSWIVVAYRFLAAVWFAGLGLWEIWSMRQGPRAQRIFRWTALVSTAVVLLILVLLLH